MTTAPTNIAASGSHANGRDGLPEPISDPSLARRTPGMLYGSASTSKGPAIWALAMNGPLAPLGTRHEYEQVPPQP